MINLKNGVTRETVVYNGRRFNRYPNAKRPAERKYYSGWVYYDGVKTKERLHRYKWVCEKGPIPEGHHINHVDGDTLNNDIGNYTCVPGSEHISKHYKDSSQTHKDELKRYLVTKAQEAAKAWHKTEKGRKWHSEHAIKQMERTHRPAVCTECGSAYTAKGNREAKFCTDRCRKRSAARTFRAKHKNS